VVRGTMRQARIPAGFDDVRMGLSAMVLPAVLTARESARNASCKSCLKEIALGLTANARNAH
jgi:hypothetical protein